MHRGYLYALINPSIPGAVKVGRTDRDPADRAGELSSATGVPTPFIVAYDEYFSDCVVAENFVHAALEARGYRISANREFFSAPLNEVVKAISSAPGKLIRADLQRETIEADGEENIASKIIVGTDDLDSLTLGKKKADAIWDDILEEADKCYSGVGDTIQDFGEALRLYKQAAKLGSERAYRQLGQMHEQGEGVREDPQKALEYYKAGARIGSWSCLGYMGNVFLQGKDITNARKCFAKMLDVMPVDPTHEVLSDLVDILLFTSVYVNVLDCDIPELSFLSNLRQELLLIFQSRMENFQKMVDCGALQPDFLQQADVAARRLSSFLSRF